MCEDGGHEGSDFGGGDGAVWATFGDAQIDKDEARLGRERLEIQQFTEAATDAASVLDISASGWVLERSLENELLLALARRPGGDRWHRVIKVANPYWTLGLGGVDLVRGVPPRAEILVELKIHNADESLWDMFKIVDLAIPPVLGFLVVIASQKRWSKQEDPAELFSPAIDDWHTHAVRDLYGRYASAWAYLTGPRGSKPRPLSLPEQIAVRTVVTVPLTHRPEFELRAIQVAPASDARLGLSRREATCRLINR